MPVPLKAHLHVSSRIISPLYTHIPSLWMTVTLSCFNTFSGISSLPLRQSENPLAWLPHTHWHQTRSRSSIAELLLAVSQERSGISCSSLGPNCPHSLFASQPHPPAPAPTQFWYSSVEAQLKQNLLPQPDASSVLLSHLITGPVLKWPLYISQFPTWLRVSITTVRYLSLRSGKQQVFNNNERRCGEKEREEVRREDRKEGGRDGQRPAGEIRQDWVLRGDCADKADTKLNAASNAVPAHLPEAGKKPFQISCALDHLCSNCAPCSFRVIISLISFQFHDYRTYEAVLLLLHSWGNWDWET